MLICLPESFQWAGAYSCLIKLAFLSSSVIRMMHQPSRSDSWKTNIWGPCDSGRIVGQAWSSKASILIGTGLFWGWVHGPESKVGNDTFTGDPRNRLSFFSQSPTGYDYTARGRSPTITGSLRQDLEGEESTKKQKLEMVLVWLPLCPDQATYEYLLLKPVWI